MTDIPAERHALARVGLVMVTREDWQAVQSYTSARACTIPATSLWAHISVTQDPDDLAGHVDDRMRTIERIGQERFEVGFPYNAAAFDSGQLCEGQPLSRRGTHTANDKHLDRCVTAGCPSKQSVIPKGGGTGGWNLNVTGRAIVVPQMCGDQVTDLQVRQMARWGAAQKLCGYATAGARWHGHRCVAAKACPCDQMWTRMDDLADLTADLVRQGHVEDGMTPEQEAKLDAFIELEADRYQVYAARYQDVVGRLARLEAAAASQADDEANLTAAINGAATAQTALIVAAVREELADAEINVDPVVFEAASERATRRVLGGLDA